MTSRIKLLILMTLLIASVGMTTVLAESTEETQEQLNIEEEKLSLPQEEITLSDVPMIVIENEQPVQASDFAEVRYTTSDIYVYDSPDDTVCRMVIGKGNQIKIGASEYEGWYKIYIGDLTSYIKTESLEDERTKQFKEEKPYYSDEVLLSAEEQEHLWNVCRQYGIKYCFALGTIELESGKHDESGILTEFNRNAKHHNSNGSIDRGICQVNSCWISKLKKLGIISCADDLYNSTIGINAGMWVLSDAVNQFGNTEKAYAYYNTGNPKVNSNKNSRQVVQYWEKYKAILGDI